jgi:type 1 glutamine amidotransferase
MAAHVVFISGENEYKSERTLPLVVGDVERELGLRCTHVRDRVIEDVWKPKVGDRLNDMAGIETLQQADAVVFYMRFRTLPEAQLAVLQTYLDSGRPVIGLRTSTHAFNYAAGDALHDWNQFGARVLGAPWIHHYGHESSTDVAVNPEAKNHPILAGVDSSFHVRSWLYQVQPEYPPKSATPLLTGTSVGPSDRPARQQNPVAWTQVLPKGNRVFTTTMGHPEDFEVPAFRKLLVNGIKWAVD